MRKKINYYYNQKYFKDRDHVDMHIAETVKIIMQKNSFKKVLDVGCGTGQLIKYLNQNKFESYGCDISVQAIKIAEKINPKKCIFLAPAEKLPFKKNSFDMITIISVIEHLSDKQIIKFLNETQRLLVKNGILFIVTPNFATPFRWLQGKKWFGYSDPTHINFFSPKRLIKQLRGFNYSEFNTVFKTNFNSEFDLDLPGFLQFLPKFMKTTLLFFLISTPLCFIRNSFWLSARKQ